MTTDEHDFAASYQAARSKEGWVDDDATVRNLPRVPRSHPHAAEWRVRAITLERLVQLLRPFTPPVRILDVGCGNGWLSARLAQRLEATVIGIDVVADDIEQAKRAWADIPTVTFFHGSIPFIVNTMHVFDVVLYAASMQYMQDARSSIEIALQITSRRGMVIVADTHWYDSLTIDAARERSIQHYAAIGVPSMIDCYFHHDINLLRGLAWRTVPITLTQRLQWMIRFRMCPHFPLMTITHA